MFIKHSINNMHTRMKGFGLMEVLVTFSIMSIALIGMTRVILLSQQSITNNAYRTQALILAQDMVGRILANSANSRACTLSDYHTLGVNGATLLADNTKCYGGTGTGNLASCTPIEVAQQDVREWKRLVSNVTDASSPGTLTQGLPNGVGVVCCTNNINSGSATDYSCDGSVPSIAQYAVKVHWRGRDGSNQRVVVGVIP